MSMKPSFRRTASYEEEPVSRRPFRNPQEPSVNLDGSAERRTTSFRASAKTFSCEKTSTPDVREDRPFRSQSKIEFRNNDERKGAKHSAGNQPFRAGNHSIPKDIDVCSTKSLPGLLSEEPTAQPLSPLKQTDVQGVPREEVPAKPHKEKGALSAADLKERILQKVPMILHAGVLYAYNGRTYTAINDASQLVGIVINMVDERMFGLTSTFVFNSVLTMLQVDKRLEPEDYAERLIASEDIVVFRNTLLNVRTMKKLPFNPWYITNFEIDANYLAHPEPTEFLKFLRTSSGGDPEIEARIADCISTILSGSNRGKMFFVLGSAPDSGKSSLAAVLQGIIPEKYLFHIAPHELKDRFSLGGHMGKILNISMDLPSTKLHSEVVATIKKITGGDRLMSQEKNEKKEFGVSSLRLLFGSNAPISVHESDDNDAFWSRLEVIPFTISVPTEAKDPHLVQKLLEERDDLVSFCIRRFPEIIARGYKLSPCQTAEDIKDEWRYGIPDTDSLESFCNTFAEITGDIDDVILATDLYNPYKEYCRSVNIKPLSEEKIKKWLSSRGVIWDRKRHNGSENAKSLFFGIRILSSEPQ